MKTQLIKLTIPILLTQMLLVLAPITDTIYAGQYSALLLAALGLGASIYVTLYVILIGIIQIFNALLSHAHGAKETPTFRHLHGQAYLLIAILSVIGIAILNYSPLWMYATADNSSLQELIVPYLRGMAAALPAALLIRFGTTYLNTLNQPWNALVIALFYLFFKVSITLTLLLNMSHSHMEAITNCALSSTITNWSIVSILFIFMASNRKLTPYLPTWPSTICCKKTIKKVLRLGWSNGIIHCIQSTSFYIISMIMVPLGVHQIGANHIASNLVSIIYVGPVSLGTATTILVARQRGAEKYDGIRQTLRSSMRIALFCSIFLALLMVGYAHKISNFFNNNPNVGSIVLPLIPIISLFQIFDWMSIIQYAVLKGMEQTFWPMIIYMVCMWGIGIGGGYIATLMSWQKTFETNYLGVQIFWMSCTLSLAICNAFLHICYIWTQKNLHRNNYQLVKNTN
ncbi:MULTISPECIES: MATE family efflux transporter [Candidatus Ichthyocystis]|uniref:Putative multidrug efflux protein n=1 Tax=Candidatus Ichthyocystis hellenicum TaxID=1561003 RepID=A0A0S4M4F5_9BURK|nr:MULTISPECIES: MATE family efflux transporter [Ichthyocystis]CUT17887.1 putative multidrug efflux protein [Candidatus Ichthyocystis hellenicum]